MATQRLIVAIGRIERALTKIEHLSRHQQTSSNNELSSRYEKLKAEASAAMADIESILAKAS